QRLDAALGEDAARRSRTARSMRLRFQEGLAELRRGARESVRTCGWRFAPQRSRSVRGGIDGAHSAPPGRGRRTPMRSAFARELRRTRIRVPEVALAVRRALDARRTGRVSRRAQASASRA